MSCSVELETDPNTNSGITAALCAKNFIEFSGRQQSIKSFIVRNESTSEIVDANDHSHSTASSDSRNPKSPGSKHRIYRGDAVKTKTAEEEKLEWQQVLSGRPPPTPLCYCRQPTVLRSVVKGGENMGRKFYVCTKPAGEKGSEGARCNFFKWEDNKMNKKPKVS